MRREPSRRQRPRPAGHVVRARRRHRPESGTGVRGERKERERKRKRKGEGYSTARPAAAAGPRRHPTMIKAILIFNNHGKPRLSKFYQRYVRVGRARRGGRGPGDGRAWRQGGTRGSPAQPGPGGCAGPRAAPWGRGRC